MPRPNEYTPIQNASLWRLTGQLTSMQILRVLLYLAVRNLADRESIIQRIAAQG